MQIYMKDSKALKVKSVGGGVLTPKSSGETWVLNKAIDTSSTFDYTTNFISNNIEYVRIVSSGRLAPGVLNHNLSYYNIDGALTIAFNGEFNTWTNQAYRKLIFDTVPTGGLLIWLQANAVKQ